MDPEAAIAASVPTAAPVFRCSVVRLVLKSGRQVLRLKQLGVPRQVRFQLA